jgi:hypothetical protein
MRLVGVAEPFSHVFNRFNFSAMEVVPENRGADGMSADGILMVIAAKNGRVDH